MSNIKLYFRNEKTTDTWLTPLYLIEALGIFDLDPCGYPGHPTANSLILKMFGSDGLSERWRGRVWLNPPYGKECGLWMDKMVKHGRGTALVFARIETRWFQKTIKHASAILFPAGRISFIRTDGKPSASASAPSCFIAFGQTDALLLETSGIKGWFVKGEKYE